MADRPNLIVIVSDTLRRDFLGCYGSRAVRTPNFDAFAAQAVRFNAAFPESLPTIPVRRALHTGRRAYPFRDYRPLKWDIVRLPGWQALANEEDTLAENLAEAGYHTGLVTDTLPYFAPGFNFHRGFYQWEFVRGQQQDRWKSPYAISPARLARYGDPEELRRDIYSIVPMHLANTAHVRGEEDTTTAQIFQWAIDFMERNRHGQPFYLLIDCFDPHEPWEAPNKYYRLYGDANYNERRILHCGYGPAERFGYTPGEIDYVRAQYSGLVSLVDAWFGRFVKWLDEIGYGENTAVIVTSDHGTNFCENPRNIIGKPEDALYPAVMQLPLLVRLPGMTEGGNARDERVYNLDLTATLYELAGMASPQGVDGQSLLPLLTGEGTWQPREYVTCRYGHSLCYVDDTLWAITDIDGKRRELFDLHHDPACQEPLKGDTEALFARAWDRLKADAAGPFPDYRESQGTDAIGQRPIEN